MKLDIGTKIGLICGAIALVMCLTLGGCGDDPQPAAKNRVPTVAEQLTQAQDSAAQAKADADRANQTLKDIQAGLDKLNNAGRNADGSWKVGSPEKTGVGNVTSVGYSKTKEGENYAYNLWFTFAERTGFVRTFSPVCPNQSVPANNTVVLNFHWQQYTGMNDPGCYAIDGFTVIK